MRGITFARKIQLLILAKGRSKGQLSNKKAVHKKPNKSNLGSDNKNEWSFLIGGGFTDVTVPVNSIINE